MKKKIVYFVHCYPPAIGGLEFLSGEIVKILKEAGYDVQVITGRGKTLDSYKTFSNWVDDKKDPKYIHRLPLKKQWQRLTNKMFNKLIFISGSFSPWYFGPMLDYDDKTLEIIKNSDLIFGAGVPTKMFYDAYRFAKKYKKKLICLPAYHNVNYYNYSYFFQKALSFAKKIICLTPHEANSLKSHYQIKKNQIEILTYCPYAKEDWRKAIKRSQIKDKELQKKIKKSLPITIGYVGQITLRKNLQFFANFIQENSPNLNNEGVKINFIFAGARTNSSIQIEKLFTNYSNSVKFIYNFNDKDKSMIYKQIDIFINPSKEESLGLVNFEALFYGLPLLVNKHSAFASIFNNFDSEIEKYNKNSFKTNLFRKILNKNEILKFININQNFINNFNKNRSINTLLSLLN
jgi:glycosyltransferase involved in cell wall biosynthesis